MKNNITNNLLFFGTLLMVLFQYGCSNDINQLVAKNGFICYINEKLYIPNAGTGKGGGKIPPITWSYNDTTKLCTIYTRGDYRIRISFNQPLIGKNIITDALSDSFDTRHSGIIVKNETNFYTTKKHKNNGFLNFTKLTSNHLMGTFQCTLYNNNNELIKINGQFDLQK
ncbi:hypothetical protein [Tenacibaculum sp. 190524A02b]|uniref:hypothetical protein n=1 Tax=Tenacibaculum vairaonense TaxID=3137860 RepID=UPI0031FB55CD